MINVDRALHAVRDELQSSERLLEKAIEEGQDDLAQWYRGYGNACMAIYDRLVALSPPAPQSPHPKAFALW